MADAELETILKEVEWVASENGEQAINLQHLKKIDSNYSNPKKKLEFELKVPGSGIVNQTPPYATCEIETALEVDGRYFKVEEIQV